MKFNDPDVIRLITREWKGERFADGRPRVSDSLLKRLSCLTTEEIYIPLYQKGYKLHFESGLKAAKPDQRLIGRAVTAVMVPSRPDVHIGLLEHGRQVENRKGFFNQWVIETLVENDVLVVDMCDQVMYGTYVGGNLSTAIRTRTKTGGAIIWGGIRDLEQIVHIPDIQIYYRGVHPSPISDVMMTAMNVPTRIGRAVCLPGDVVVGTISGVSFIPAHMAEYVAVCAEKSHIKDVFGFERLRTKAYTVAQIDSGIWSREMMDDFCRWLKTSPEAADYQHLEWSEEYAHCDDSVEANSQFNGLVTESFG